MVRIFRSTTYRPTEDTNGSQLWPPNSSVARQKSSSRQRYKMSLPQSKHRPRPRSSWPASVIQWATDLLRALLTVTGTSFVTSLIVGKQLELLKQITPPVVLLALLLNPANPGHPLLLREAQAVAPSLGVQLLQLEVRGPNELDSGFARLAKDHAGALFVPWDGTFLVHLTQIVRLAGRTRLPTLYGQRGYVAAGGFVSYGPSAPEAFRRAASYVDKILKGAAPGDLPIEQPTKFELVINLKTAKALGLTIPQSLLLRADHVIQ